MRRCRDIISILGPLLLLTLIGRPVRCQEIKGEVKKVELHGDEVTIIYDLKGIADDEYVVKVFVYPNRRPDLIRELETARGDVGKGKFAGVGHRIYWNMKEFSDIREGEGFIFKILVDTPGIPWYYWAGGGAAAAGGILAVILSKGETKIETGGSVTRTIPVPPGR